MEPNAQTQPRRRRLGGAAAALAVGLAGLSLLAAGCGGGSPAVGVAQVATTTTPSSSQASSKSASPAAYSACMRKHGVTNFPDPDSQGRLKVTSGFVNGHQTGVAVNSPQFKKAQQACQKLQPGGGKTNPQAQAKELQTMLKFSACMRSHGVPKFPDPKASGGGILMTIGKNAGVDPNSPQFKAAQKVCGKLFGGGPNTIGPGPGGATSAP